MNGRLALTLVLTCFLTGPQLRGGTAAKDQEAMQGTWQIIEANVEGEKATDPDFLKSKITFAGNRVKMAFGGKDEPREFTVELDPSKKPKHIDMIALNGPYVGTKGLGIYKLDQDVLTLVIPNKQKSPRPTAFESPAKSGLALMILKKMKAK